jgi:hypothetical protein
MKNLKLSIVQKDTKVYTFHLTRNNVPVNISGWYLYFTVKTDFNDSDTSAKIKKDILFPTNTDSQNGIGYLELTSAETDIDLGEYYYDFKFIATDYRETFISGKLIIMPSIRAN